MSPETRLEKDPSEDREEFERGLKIIFSMQIKFNLEDAVKALLLNDSLQISKYVADINALEAKKAYYLNLWDGCKNKTEKMTVVESVRID